MEAIVNNWIDEIRIHPDESLRKVYQTEREFCLAWLQKNTNLSIKDNTEIFQNAVVILYDNIISGKLVEARSKRSTYLISICRNLSFDYKRKYDKQISVDTFPILEEHIDGSQEEYDKKEKRFRIVAQILRKMGSPCKDLIELYYYQKMSMVDICNLMNYKTVASTKNQKYKCIQRLKTKVAIKN